MVGETGEAGEKGAAPAAELGEAAADPNESAAAMDALLFQEAADDGEDADDAFAPAEDAAVSSGLVVMRPAAASHFFIARGRRTRRGEVKREEIKFE